MKIAFVTESLDVSFGGPAHSIPKLVVSLLRYVDQLKVFIVKKKNAPLKNALLDKTALSYQVFDAALGFKIEYCPQFGESLKAYVGEDEGAIVHVNSLWRWAPYKALKLAHSKGRASVLSPRGMLLGAAFSKERFVKTIVWKLWFRSLVNKVDCIHVTSQAEACSLRDMGITVPIAVIAHGIDPYRTVSLQQEKLAKQNLNLDVERQYILFLSRVIEHKGVHLLLEAFANIRDDYVRNFDILIAGDFEDLEYKSRIESMVVERELTNRVKFFGEVSGTIKNDIFCAASFFVLPSRSENFGVVIGEALSYGLPVITTQGTPWSVLSERRIGAWIPREVTEIEVQIKKFCSMSDQECKSLQPAIRSIVSDYSWDKTSEDMFKMYSWLNDRKVTPEFIMR